MCLLCIWCKKIKFITSNILQLNVLLDVVGWFSFWSWQVATRTTITWNKQKKALWSPLRDATYQIKCWTPLLPWFCATVQNENQTQSHEFLNTDKLKVQWVPLTSALTQICHSVMEVQRGLRVTEHNTVFQFVNGPWSLSQSDLTQGFNSIRHSTSVYGQPFVSAWAQPSSAQQQECHVYILLLFTITKLSIKK